MAAALVTIDSRDRTPIYAQLDRGCARRLPPVASRSAISSRPSASSRSICSINANTVARVYVELERAGIIETRRGIGSFVAPRRDTRIPRTFTARRLRAFVTRVLADAAAAGFSIDDVAAEMSAHPTERSLTVPLTSRLAPRSPTPAAAEHRRAPCVARAVRDRRAAGLHGSAIRSRPSPGRSSASCSCSRRASRSSGSAAVVLRLGSYVGLRGPGLFWIRAVLRHRLVVDRSARHHHGFAAEQTLTSDTVPVNVDAVLFWMVHDPEKAALEVQDYDAGRELGGADRAARHHRPHLARRICCAAARQIEEELQMLIDARSNPWGVTVQSVEMRDIVIPASLQDAMSREAQATREKQARVILGEAEVEIAQSFEEAAKSYRDNPTALHLRAMNMLYEGLKEKGALMLIPSSAVESMGMGGTDRRRRVAAATADAGFGRGQSGVSHALDSRRDLHSAVPWLVAAWVPALVDPGRQLRAGRGPPDGCSSPPARRSICCACCDFWSRAARRRFSSRVRCADPRRGTADARAGLALSAVA